MSSKELFGLQPITSELLTKLSFLSPRIQSLLEFSRGVDSTTDFTESCYIYTGRGPSKASFHLGHLPGLQVCLALQSKFGSKIEFMISDDEKIFRDGITVETMNENVLYTLKQLEVLGFTESNTKFRINSKGITETEYSLIIQMLGMVSVNTLNHIFGEKDNLGEYFYPLLQILPSLSKDRQCIVVAGVDQDPFFRLARDLAKRLKFIPPVIFYTKSVPGLDGSEKMSTSVPESIPIFFDDTPQMIKEKVSKIRKVGAGSLDQLFEYGANLEVDIPYQLLKIFDDSGNLELIAKSYTGGLTDQTEIDILRRIIPGKGVQERTGKTMLTTSGIRAYLSTVLISNHYT